jgi:hypothetical protein
MSRVLVESAEKKILSLNNIEQKEVDDDAAVGSRRTICIGTYKATPCLSLAYH